MRILISGSTGLIGRNTCVFFRNLGHEVVPLFRSASNTGVFWDPQSGSFDIRDFEHFDVIIHLAGKSVASGIWTEAFKQEVFRSRCRDTWLLAQIINRLKYPPKTLIVASGIGFYGSRGDALLTEKDSPGKGFLAEVCKGWEESTASIDREVVRVIHTRFGVVLSPKGGALKKLVSQFRFGLGAVLGMGGQYFPWVALEDVIECFCFLLDNAELSGPVNVVSPLPITNRYFSKKLADALNRPCWLRIPEWVLRRLLGEMADEMFLASTRVIPEKLISAGFTFKYERVEDYFASF